jgi:hypothetical protein
MSDALTAKGEACSQDFNLTGVADADLGFVVRDVKNHLKILDAYPVGSELRVVYSLDQVLPDKLRLTLEVLEEFVNSTISNHTSSRVGYRGRRKPQYVNTTGARSAG